MATVRFEPNFSAFRDLANGPEMRAACLAEAERAQVIAEGLAADFSKTGTYARSFSVRTETVDLGSGPRVAGILENDATNAEGHVYAASVEWGNKNDHNPHRVLGRTLDALGK